MSGTGDQFQKKTKYDRRNIPRPPLAYSTRPALYKEYPNSPKIELEAFEPPDAMSLDQVLKRRKSIRDFQQRPMSKGQLSYLLWASTAIQRVEYGYEFRTAPSAGARYPIETYVIANNVSRLENGLYHYSIKNHQLEQLKQQDLSKQIASAALNQNMCAEAAVVFIWTAVFDRSKYKYGQRAYRYIYLDTGHIGQNLALAAVSLNLGTCQIGALYDDEVNAILDIDGTNESVVYMTVVGVPM